MHEALALCSSCLEKVNTEAARLGLIKRKLVVPEPTTYSTPAEMADILTKHFMVCAKLFKLVLDFMTRYLNDSYSMALVVNMNRMRSAEIDLNELLKTTKDLVSIMNMLRLRNMCTMVYIKVLWVRRARDKMVLNKRKLFAAEEELQVSADVN